MRLAIATPLMEKTLKGKELKLFPVIMNGELPTRGWGVWQKFIKPMSQRIRVSTESIDRIQEYMQCHHTEALSEDGVVAYTIYGNSLVECDPDRIK